MAQPAVAPSSPRQRALAEPYLRAAIRRERLAHDLSSQPSPVESALLLRETIVLLTRAVFAARSTRADEARVPSLDTLSALGELRLAVGRSSNADARRVDQAIGSTDPLYFDSLDEVELKLTYDALALEAASLRELVDLRTPTYLAGARVGRVLAVALLVSYFGYTAASTLWRPRDLALGKPVRLSSQEAGTPDPSGLVDGTHGKTFGAHTKVSLRPGWAIIDLGRDTSIKKIIVYNRGDSNLNDGLPYFVDLSNDGEAWREAAKRDTPFGDGGFLSPPWSISLHDRTRYVRIRSTWYLALSEVEVF